MSHIGFNPTDTLQVHRMLLERMPGMRRYLKLKIPKKLQRLINAEDLIQDVSVCVFLQFARFVDDGDRAFDRWLQTILSRKLYDAVKAAKRARRQNQGSSEFSLIDGSDASGSLPMRRLSGQVDSTPSREVSFKEASHAMADAMANLPTEYRTALRMRFVEGHSRDSIADAMNRTVYVVNGLLHRGLRMLRERMGPSGQFFSDSASMERLLRESGDQAHGSAKETDA